MTWSDETSHTSSRHHLWRDRATALLGVALHYGISLAIVAAYFLASRAWPALVLYPFIWGSVYGVGVYFFMNYAVIPLSATARPRFLASWVIAASRCMH